MIIEEGGFGYEVRRKKGDSRQHLNELQDERSIGNRIVTKATTISMLTYSKSILQQTFSNCTLEQWMDLYSNQPLSKKASLLHQVGIARGIMDGLIYLHDRGLLLQGKLRPENVRFSSAGDTSFTQALCGINKAFGLPVVIGNFYATEDNKRQLYTPPEVLLGESYSIQSDLYSLGIILREMVEVISKETTCQAFPQVSEAIELLTKKDPMERIKSVAALSSSLTINAWVEDSFTLQQILKFCRPGDTINLKKGDYDGPITINCDNVTIQGNGSATTIKSQLRTTPIVQVNGSYCVIRDILFAHDHLAKSPFEDIKVCGSHNLVQSVALVNCGLNLIGNQNFASNIAVTSSQTGIKITGDDNVVKHVTMERLHGSGVQVIGDRNTLTDLSMIGVCTGIVILHGNENNVTNVFYQNPPDANNNNKRIGLSIVGGNMNRVCNLRCTNLALDQSSKNCVLRNVHCGFVQLYGRNHEISFSDGGRGEIDAYEGNNIYEINVEGKFLLSDR